MRGVVLAAMLCVALSSPAQTVVEYPVAYPNQTSVETGACHPAPKGSTHEITFDAKGGNTFWITGQNYDQVVQVAQSGAMTFYPMTTGSGPHGIEFDADQRLWVTLEFAGQIVRLDANGKVQQTIDVNLDCATCVGGKLNPHPHGMGFGADGKTIWFTGKGTGTVGKIAPDGKITTYPLKTVGSVPIYVRAGNDGTMWVTELVGNKIARIGTDGSVLETPIPTNNSRPIAIVPEPGSNAMWFSEEAGNRVARISADGKTITEYQLPLSQANVILAGLAFDSDKNLWVQQYVDQNAPTPSKPSPEGADHIIRIDQSILTAAPGDLTKVPITYYKVPTTQTIMHRIVQGPDGNIWFTELGSNKVGKVVLTQ
jgi:virginiamycin B lyase